MLREISAQGKNVVCVAETNIVNDAEVKHFRSEGWCILTYLPEKKVAVMKKHNFILHEINIDSLSKYRVSSGTLDSKIVMNGETKEELGVLSRTPENKPLVAPNSEKPLIFKPLKIICSFKGYGEVYSYDKYRKLQEKPVKIKYTAPTCQFLQEILCITEQDISTVKDKKTRIIYQAEYVVKQPLLSIIERKPELQILT